MSTHDLENLITFRLARLVSELNRQSNRLLRQTGGLNVPEWRVVSLLGVGGEMNGRQLGSLARLDPGLLSRTLNGLEQRGLIVTTRRPNDRRAVWASLTPAGWEVEKATRPVMLARHDRLLAALSPDEREIILPLIDRLYQTIAAENAASGED
ncbi:MAG: MarR family transcriptional regulator [Beijerinckiaceae bacterium]|jgi:DNA-binding MarR family transcriptional regulator|nr:MarR family transcriptional regulator [Beijerinckiaceae bacterium]